MCTLMLHYSTLSLKVISILFGWLMSCETHPTCVVHLPCKPLLSFHTIHWNVCMHKLHLNDVDTFVVSILQLWKCTWCWYSRFLSPCPSSLMTTTVKKKKKKKKKETLGEQNYMQVCQSKFVFTPLHVCVCYVSQPNSLPGDGPRTARWIWVKGSTEAWGFYRTWRLRKNTREMIWILLES